MKINPTTEGSIVNGEKTGCLHAAAAFLGVAVAAAAVLLALVWLLCRAAK